MLWGAALLMLAIGDQPPSLIANPSFEITDLDGRPRSWDLFVMPQQGAKGALHHEAADGKFSAMLVTPQPYNEEPFNNWSQNIFSDVAGKTVILQGQIKTEEATEATLWLQCWQRRPTRILKTVSTSTETPLYGTHDWTPVSVTAEVPEETAFMVVRCVLRGRGTAWFDAIRLVVEEVPIEFDEGDFLEPPDVDNKKDIKEALTAHEALLQANKSLQQALHVLSETNDSMAGQIQALYEKLDSLRRELSAIEGPAGDTFYEVPEPTNAPQSSRYREDSRAQGSDPLVRGTQTQRNAPRGFLSRFRNRK